MALTDLFRVRWTDRIHDEWIGNLVAAGHDAHKLARTRRLMNEAIPDCLIEGYASLVESVALPDPDDRHVLAAAITGGVDVIVTANVKHFPERVLEPYGVEAQHPDDFVTYQFDLNPGRYCTAIKAMRARLKNPPYTVEQFLQCFEKLRMPQTVQRLRYFADAL
jgi:hypothetical protein